MENIGVQAMTSSMLAAQELQKPIYHRTIDLGIRKMKKEVRRINPNVAKSKVNLFIQAYKHRAWMEAEGRTRGLGSMPTRPKYGNSVEITTSKDEYKVKVKNEK